MLDILLVVVAIATGGGKAGQAVTTITPQSGSVIAQAPAVPQGKGHVAENQVPSGRFTTAVEVRPILEMTRANWVAVREFNGQDLVYLTHLLSWRCGLVAIQVSINGAPLEDWEMEPCHEDGNSPNALTAEEPAVYRSYPLGSIQTVTVEITYDDLTADTATFDRKGAMIP